MGTKQQFSFSVSEFRYSALEFNSRTDKLNEMEYEQ